MTNDEDRSIGLGDHIDDFKPMMGNIIAGFIISTLLVLGGLAAVAFPLHAAYEAGWNLPFNVKKGLSWLAVGFFGVLGIGLMVGGVLLAAYSRRLISRHVEICENGFRYCSGRCIEAVFWDDVGRIQETILYERPPILKGPAKFLLPKVASTSYTVVTTLGKQYCFDGNSIKAMKRFGKVLREQAARLSLPWETVEQHG